MEVINKIEEFNWDGMEGFLIQTTDQIIELWISNFQSCCESWGYFWCNDNPQDFIGASLLGITLTNTALNTKTIEEHHADSLDDGGIMFVNFETNRGVLQFVAYNAHNGFYGHEVKVESKQLNHSDCL